MSRQLFFLSSFFSRARAAAAAVPLPSFQSFPTHTTSVTCSFLHISYKEWLCEYSTHLHTALCSTLVIRPRLNSAKGYFFPKSGLSYVFVYDLMIYDHFLSTLWVFCRKEILKRNFGLNFKLSAFLKRNFGLNFELSPFF